MRVRPGAIVRDARHAAGLTQRELGRLAGTTQSAVARVENHRTSPSVVTLERLVNATGRELILDARLPPVDHSLIRENLRRTPLERLGHHDASRRNMIEFASSARRVSQ